MITQNQYRNALKASLKQHQIVVRNIPQDIKLLLAQAMPGAHTLPGGVNVSDFTAFAHDLSDSLTLVTKSLRAYLDRIDASAKQISTDILVRGNAAIEEHGDFSVYSTTDK